MLAAESKLIPLAISHRLLGHSRKQHAQLGLLVPGMVSLCCCLQGYLGGATADSYSCSGVAHSMGTSLQSQLLQRLRQEEVKPKVRLGND